MNGERNGGKVMKVWNMHRLVLIVFVVWLVTLCSSCWQAQPPEQQVHQRVAAFWDHRIAGEFDKAYDFEYPLHRKNMDRNIYLQGINQEVKFVSAQVEEILFPSADVAEVSLKVRLRISPPGIRNAIEQEVETHEQWARIEGQWYHVPKKKGRLGQDDLPVN